MFQVDLKAAHVAGFFKDVVFSATGELKEQVSQALSLGGAKKMNYLTGNSTHCIVGTNPDQNDIVEATEMLDVPAVSQDWVLASLHCNKLLPIKAFSPTAKLPLSGVFACTDDSILPPDLDLLWALVTFNGGKLTKTWSNQVTHLLATRPGSALYNRLNSSKASKIVTPDWVTDSVEKSGRADESIYHPRLLNVPDTLPKPAMSMTRPPVAKSEMDKVAAQTGKLGVNSPGGASRLPGPPTLAGTPGPRLPGPPRTGPLTSQLTRARLNSPQQSLNSRMQRPVGPTGSQVSGQSVGQKPNEAPGPQPGQTSAQNTAVGGLRMNTPAGSMGMPVSSLPSNQPGTITNQKPQMISTTSQQVKQPSSVTVSGAKIVPNLMTTTMSGNNQIRPQLINPSNVTVTSTTLPNASQSKTTTITTSGGVSLQPSGNQGTSGSNTPQLKSVTITTAGPQQKPDQQQNPPTTQTNIQKQISQFQGSLSQSVTISQTPSMQAGQVTKPPETSQPSLSIVQSKPNFPGTVGSSSSLNTSATTVGTVINTTSGFTSAPNITTGPVGVSPSIRPSSIPASQTSMAQGLKPGIISGTTRLPGSQVSGVTSGPSGVTVSGTTIGPQGKQLSGAPGSSTAGPVGLPGTPVSLGQIRPAGAPGLTGVSVSGVPTGLQNTAVSSGPMVPTGVPISSGPVGMSGTSISGAPVRMPSVPITSGPLGLPGAQVPGSSLPQQTPTSSLQVAGVATSVHLQPQAISSTQQRPSLPNQPTMMTSSGGPVPSTGNMTFQARAQMQQQQVMTRPGMPGVMTSGQQLVRIQGGQQVTLQPGQPVTIQGQQMRMQGPGQMGQIRGQGHPAILQQHEQIRLQGQQQSTQQTVSGQMMQGHITQPGQIIQPGQQTIMQQQQQWSGQQQQPGQMIQQQQPGQPIMQAQQWNPQNQQMMQQQGMAQRMMGRNRAMSPLMHKQQAVIQSHLSQLTPEQRQQFSNMNPREKQQYLAQKGLLVPNPTAQWGQTVQLQRHTIQLTEQQKQMLQNMNHQDRSLFIQKLSKERETQLRMQMQQQNMMAQQQQQSMMAQQQQGVIPQQNMPTQQSQQQGMVAQPPSQGQGAASSPVTSQWQQGSPVPSSPQQQPVSPMHPNMSPGNISPGQPVQRMASPVGSVTAAGVPPRPPPWSGETHPALAQVPRTPQQIQHLQRLQMQRQQIGSGTSGATGGVATCDAGGVSVSSDPSLQQQPGQVKQVVVSAGGMADMVTSGQQVAQSTPGMHQQVLLGPNGQSQTKVALQNMLSNRLGPGGQPLPPGPAQQPVSLSPADPSAGPGANRIQIMNQPPGMIPTQQQHMMQQQQHQQQQLLAMQRNNALRNVTNTPPQHGTPMMGGKPVSMAGMAGPRFGPPRQVGPGSMVGMRAQVPGLPQARLPQFIGHQLETRLPPDLCLLGCIFVVTDYQESEDHAKYVASWKKTITQYGGEIEDSLSPRVTHLLCSSQKSGLAQQARVEGKRLVTSFWLNDTIKKKKVMPPWKAIHFPLPAQFEPPCTNMILTLTGFQERDRDYVKEMVKIVGAKYTSYFTRHNHALICKAPVGEKYDKAREWKVPVVSVQWLNDVMFGSVNAAQCMSNAKYQGFKSEDPLRIDYNLVPHLIAAWKLPGIRVTPETYQKFKANPPARIKRKADKQRQEREAEEKRQRLNDERQEQGLPPLEPGCFNMDGDTDLDPVTGLPVPRPPAPPPPTPPQKEEVKEEKGVKKEIEDEEKENNPFKMTGGPPKIMFTNMGSGLKMELNDLLTGMCSEYTCNPSEVTHLIMPRLTRTIKFILALPTVKYILTPDWIRKSKAAGKWLPEQDFIIKDEKFEEAYHCSIAKLLKNPDRSKVFHGKVFYISPSVAPSMKDLVSLVQAAGGRVENRRLKTPQQIKEMNKGGVVNYIIITCEEDLHLVTDILRAKQHIFTPEFVISAVLQCEMDFDISKYLTTINENENGL